MEHPFQGIEGPRIRLLRVHQRMEEFEAKSRLFFSGDAYRLNVQSNSEGTHHTIRVDINRLPEPELSAIVGECLYNLQAALDNAIWQHIPKNVRESPAAEGIYFPIYYWRLSSGGRKGLYPARKQKTGKKPSPPRALCYLPHEGRRHLIRMQPFRVPLRERFRHPLWVLHELARFDRHRHLPILGAVHDADWLPRVFRGTIEATISAHIGTFDHGKVIAEVTTPPNVTPHRGLDFHRSLELAFSREGPGRGVCVADALGHIHDFIATQVLPPLEELFRPPSRAR